MPHSQILQEVQRASARRSVVVHEEMKRGVNSLASVVSVAPLLGMLGAVSGIVNAFPPFVGSKIALMALTVSGLSVACIPAALGILVGLTSLWFHRYLTGRLQAFDQEMENASLELANELSRFRSPATP